VFSLHDAETAEVVAEELGVDVGGEAEQEAHQVEFGREREKHLQAAAQESERREPFVVPHLVLPHRVRAREIRARFDSTERTENCLVRNTNFNFSFCFTLSYFY